MGPDIEAILTQHRIAANHERVLGQVEGEYEVGMQDQAALGPEGGLAIPPEVLKELDRYLNDFRPGESDDDDPLFTDRRADPLTGQAIRRLFDRLKVRTGIRDLCAHMLRHTWATNYNRSGSGSAFDLQVEGGWTTGQMVERCCKVRPLAERRRAPSPFSAPRAAAAHAGKRPAEKRPPQQKSALSGTRIA